MPPPLRPSARPRSSASRSCESEHPGLLRQHHALPRDQPRGRSRSTPTRPPSSSRCRTSRARCSRRCACSRCATSTSPSSSRARSAAVRGNTCSTSTSPCARQDLQCTRALVHLAEFARSMRTLGSYPSWKSREAAQQASRHERRFPSIAARQRRHHGRSAAARGARAMLKAVGFDDAALKKPIVGVANTWIEIGPCNYHLRDAGRAREGRHPRGRRHADGVQHRLDLRRHHDGQPGHAGVAHQPRGHRRLDRAGGARQLLRRRHRAVRLRQDDPGHHRWRWRGSTCRASCCTAASIAPGDFQGHDVTIQDVFEARRRARGGQDDRRRADGPRESRVPGRRRVRRPVHRQHDGDGDRVPGHRADGQRRRAGARPGESATSAARPARLVMDLLKQQPDAASSIITRDVDRERHRRRSPPRAARRTPCCTCWRSRARRASR